MRVLHVYKEFHPQASGVARHLDGLMRASAGLGVEPAVLAPDVGLWDEHAPYRVLVGGAGALRAAIGDADIVHVHGARTPLAAAAALAAAPRGRPVVYTPHCYYDDGGPMKRAAKSLWDATVERALLRGAGATILLDESWQAYLAGRRLRARRVAVVPNCVLAQAVRARRPAETPRMAGDPALVSIGRLDPVKRLDDAIAALTHSGLEGAVLHLVGTGPDRARLEEAARALGVEGRVVFHGWQPDGKAAEILLGADLFVLPSGREGLPTTMLEALLLGMPVLASDIPANAAIAAAVGWTALHRVGDVAALAEGVRAAARGPVPEEVIRAVEGRFSWEARAADIVHCYKSLMG